MEEVIKNHVLRFLPAKSLYRFKSVSKSWNRWISSPFLAHQQSTHFTKTSGFFFSDHDQYHYPFFIPLHPPSDGVPTPALSFLPVSAAIRATSHGLLCCQTTFPDTTYFLCNPATQEWTQLPNSTLFHSPNSSAIALHFTPSTYNFQSHFQIVCAVPYDPLKAVFFEIYSSRTNSWRVADSEYFYDDDQELAFRGDGFCVDGFAYWEALNGVALAFDLKYEQHGDIRLPPGHGQEGALVEMDGELCYIMPHKEENGCYNLGVYGGLNMVLKRQIPLDFGDLRIDDDADGEVMMIRVLSCVNDGTLVILVGGNNVVLYDVGEGKGSLVKWVGGGPVNRGDSGRYLPYVNSLARVCPVEKMPAEDHHVIAEVLKTMSFD